MFANIEDRDVCHEAIEDDDVAADGGGGESALLKAMRKKYLARQRSMDTTIRKLASLATKIENATKALLCCFVFVVVC